RLAADPQVHRRPRARLRLDRAPGARRQREEARARAGAQSRLSPVPRFRFGTVRLSCLDMNTAVDALFGFVAAGEGGYIACTCTHGIVDSERDERLRKILNGSLLTL